MALNSMPVRMCVVVPQEDGTFKPYCIACHWQPVVASRTKVAAERKAMRHTCRKKGDS
jgi:hypothetical protein